MKSQKDTFLLVIGEKKLLLLFIYSFFFTYCGLICFAEKKRPTPSIEWNNSISLYRSAKEARTFDGGCYTRWHSTFSWGQFSFVSLRKLSEVFVLARKQTLYKIQPKQQKGLDCCYFSRLKQMEIASLLVSNINFIIGTEIL